MLDEAFESLGIGIESNSEVNNKIKTESPELSSDVKKEKVLENKKLLEELKGSDRDIAVYEQLIPKAYRDASFDVDKIKANIIKQYRDSSKLYKVYKFNDYVGICHDILSTLRMGKLPECSYLIGAPNGFGKTSFVNECIITLRKQGYKAVPYISLWELAQIKIDNEQRALYPYKRFRENNNKIEYVDLDNKIEITKNPEIVSGRYSYSEYINADCLFVSFTSLLSKEIESHTLYQLLAIRGAKGLPTIVMISTSLNGYESDKNLKTYVWDEIKTSSEKYGCYDRVFHISCYKMKSYDIDSKDEQVDSDTGIVL